MSLLSKQIANLFNGVSQQTASARLPSQAEAQENALSSPVDGLVKRPGTDHVAKLMEAPVERPKVHTIDRDASEQYQVVVTNGNLKVFDLEGNEREVSFPSGKGYLTSDDPRGDFKLQTVADYTVFVNRKVRPQMAMSPYLTTDRVTVSLNFGEGELGNPVTYPKLPGSYFMFRFKAPLNSDPDNYGWTGPNTSYGTLAQVYDAFEDYLNFFFGGHTLQEYYKVPEVTKDGLNPKFDWKGHYQELDGASTGAYDCKGIAITQDPDFAMSLTYGNSYYPARTWDPQLRIYYITGSMSAGDGGAAMLSALRPSVGWPLADNLSDEYHTPDWTYYSHVMPVFDGRLYVSVNGHTFSIAHQNGWSAEQYTSYFAGQIRATFPSLDVTVNDGWQIVIRGAEGQAIYVTAWDDNHRGYVRAVYSELPRNESVFIVIKNGVAAQTYAVSLNGTQFSITTGATDAPETYKIDTIANNLAGAINANAAWRAAVYGGFIMVQRADGGPITFAAHDTWNDQAMYAMKNRVQAFEDLPGKFVPGYPIEVVGVDSTEGYYVHYTLEGAQAPKAYGLERQVTVERPFTLIKPAGTTWTALEGAETGTWEECAKPGALDVYIPATMPHVLISEADGTFTFKPVEWYRRPCGDDDTVPYASFVNKEILDVFFHRNRLGFMSAETLVFSKSGEFFNLWPSTARDVLDSDPIDVQVNHTKVSTLRNTAVFNNQLLIFSDSTQFVISGQQLLSPKTISVQASTEFDASAKAKPVTTGQSVHFVSEGNKWSAVWEYFVETNAVQNTAENITQHVPRYLPRDIHKLVSSTADNLLVAISDQAPSSLFVYRYLWGNEGKLQQSWSVWNTTGEILDVAFANHLMVLTIRRSDGLYLETLDLRNDVTDGDLTWRVHLDRKCAPSAVWDPILGKTVVTLPYPVPSNLKVLRADRGTSLSFKKASDFPPGTLILPGVNQVWVDGNHSEVIAGVSFKFRYRFSEVYMRDKDGRAILGSQLMLKTWALQYENTAEFDLVVMPEKRSPYFHRFRPQTIGIDALLGVVKPETGVFRKMVSGEGKTTTLEIVSESHYPCAFQSAVWEANFTNKTNRV